MPITRDIVQVFPGQLWRALAEKGTYLWQVLTVAPDGKVVMIRRPRDYRDAHEGMPVRCTTHVDRMHEFAPGEGWQLHTLLAWIT